ncbi:MAG: ABC transporter ATP-binding protein [Treponema sp.]|nr:ABC transporter ATP-binding protein [Treponema sp.]
MIKIDDISFSYGSLDIVKDFSLSIDEGQFVTLLGPSGSGKTTILRLISGFLSPDKGRIFINNEDITDLEPNKRGIAYVFQDYALFPHMTVKQNIEYGMKNPSAKDITSIAKKLNLSDLLDRFPHQLSGGQQQRVALARSLVLKPKVILMDEPLSSLDAKLRHQVREELKNIQKDFGITTIYVTHDQEEALSLSDRIAVLDKGLLQQWGNPEQLYFEPRNSFVAEITGRTNYLKLNGKNVLVRPTWVKTASSPSDFFAVIKSVSFHGDQVLLTGECPESTTGSVQIILPYEEGVKIKTGTEVYFSVTRSHILQN